LKLPHKYSKFSESITVAEVYYHGCKPGIFIYDGIYVFKAKPPKDKDLTVVNTTMREAPHLNPAWKKVGVKVRFVAIHHANGLMDVKCFHVIPIGVHPPGMILPSDIAIFE
jgi:hypothetical protein